MVFCLPLRSRLCNWCAASTSWVEELEKLQSSSEGLARNAPFFAIPHACTLHPGQTGHPALRENHLYISFPESTRTIPTPPRGLGEKTTWCSLGGTTPFVSVLLLRGVGWAVFTFSSDLAGRDRFFGGPSGLRLLLEEAPRALPGDCSPPTFYVEISTLS